MNLPSSHLHTGLTHFHAGPGIPKCVTEKSSEQRRSRVTPSVSSCLETVSLAPRSTEDKAAAWRSESRCSRLSASSTERRWIVGHVAHAPPSLAASAPLCQNA